MKKTIVLLACLMISSFAFCQSISYRTENGSQLSMGTNYIIRQDSVGIGLRYEKNTSTNDEAWGLAVVVGWRNTPFSFDAGSRLLIMTFSGKVVELKQLIDCYNIKRDNKLIGNGVTEYWGYPEYIISSDDLQKVMKDGVKKMRFETTRGFRDFVFGADEFGKVITSEHDLILGKTDFEAGF